MRKQQEVQSWVVYETIQGYQTGMKSVCEKSEWDALESSKPGFHVIIREGIVHESEAEQLARGTSGDKKTKPGT